MKRYCFDTSGISNPLETMPEDIHVSMWSQFCDLVEKGDIAVTVEIFEEMELLPGNVGNCIKDNKNELVLDVGNTNWDWQTYVDHSARMNTEYHHFISEYNGGSPKMISLNDMTIIALGKTVGIPVVSMETPIIVADSPKRRIPNICQLEDVIHLTFNEFLRAEGRIL